MRAVLSLVLALPLQAASAAGPSPKPDMRQAPAVGVWKPYAAPPRLRWTVPGNGLSVVYVESPRAPLLALRLGVRGGTALGGERDAGLVSAMAELLVEGTATRTALEQTEAAEAAGGSIGAYASEDHAVVWAEGLASKADEMLALLKETVLSPAFSEDEVALRKENMLAELKVRRSEPGWLAGAAAGRAIYGEHAYGVPGPDENSIARIERGALQRLHRQLFHPSGAVLVAVGPLSVDEFRAKVDAVWADWPVHFGLPDPPPPVLTPPAAPALSFVEKPGLEQAVVVFGLRVPREDEPGYEALLVANMVYGGSYGARLNNDLREDKGWTYGVYSSLQSLRAAGSFWVRGQFRADSVRKALEGVRSHLKRLRAAPPTAGELKQAKANLVSKLIFSFERQSGVADQVLHDALFGLPMDRIDTLPQRIESVTAEQARAAAERWLNDDNLVVGIAGDRAVLKSLQGFAPVTIVGFDGRPIPGSQLK